MNMSIAEILSLRFQFETIVSSNRYKMPRYTSNINNLEWFIKNGHKSNKNKKQFPEALEIAELVIYQGKLVNGNGKNSRKRISKGATTNI